MFTGLNSLESFVARKTHLFGPNRCPRFSLQLMYLHVGIGKCEAVGEGNRCGTGYLAPNRCIASHVYVICRI